MTDFPTFKVELDPQVERDAPPTEAHLIQWAYLDTAMKVLREGAVRAVLHVVREGAQECGGDFLSDAEIMAMAHKARAAGEEDAPCGLWDLAPFDQLTLMGLSGIFQQMMDGTLDLMSGAFEGRARFEDQLAKLLGEDPKTD